MTVLMLFGLILFVFRVESRRAFNENLTVPSVLEVFQKFFPEIDSIPHADTIARILERINLQELEAVHISMMRKLINNKKFKKLVIQNHLPISIDGTQKTTRDGQLQEEGWLLRTVHTKEGPEFQQYIFIVEANITFKNGLSIPLLTEYCYLDPDHFSDPKFKQDAELNAFSRLTDKMKKYFPRLKLILLLDSLYACQNVISNLRQKNWQFMIKLPSKLKSLCELLKTQKDSNSSIPGQTFYRERLQSFYWLNNVEYCGMEIHLVNCTDKWKSVNNKTGDPILMVSEHRWISSIPLSFANLHELCNLAARKRAYIEDNFNTEKNRGYKYKHIFSYDWNAMQGFHMLMRMAHAINAISEFTKKMKKYIKDLGWSNTLRKIFDALKHGHLSDRWCNEQLNKTPQLRFDFK